MSAELAYLHALFIFFKYVNDTAIVGYLKPDSSALTSVEEEVGNFRQTEEMVIGFRRRKSEIPNKLLNNSNLRLVPRLR